MAQDSGLHPVLLPQVEFEKSGVAIPSVDFGASTVTFPKARGIVMDPVKGSLACPDAYSYEWTVLSGTSPLVLTSADKPFLRLAPGQLVFGAAYELQLAVLIIGITAQAARLLARGFAVTAIA